MPFFLIETIGHTYGPYCEDCAIELLDLNDHMSVDLIEGDNTDLILLSSECQKCGMTL